MAILDLYSRKVLAFRVSNTLATDFCVEAMQETLCLYGSPEIFNTDQGSQFTDEDFTAVLAHQSVRISMDGKGRWVDNPYVSYCTSFGGSETSLETGCLSESFVPCALRGASGPGGSNRHSFLSR